MPKATHALLTRRWFTGVLLSAGLTACTFAPATAAERVRKVTSPGGIEAWLMESHEVGLISMRFNFEGGALAEPADKPGVAQFAAYMFNEGAGDMTPEVLSSRRMKLGVNLGGSADYKYSSISFSTPSINRSEAFALLREAIHKPRFDAEPIERARREYEASLTAEKQQPSSIAVNHLRLKLLGGTRFASSLYGTLETLATINRSDIEAYRRHSFARSNLKVAVAGDITPAELGPLLDDLVAGLPERTAVPKGAATPAQSGSDAVLPMELPQTTVMFGNVAARLDWRQSLAYSIGNDILSGDSTSRLFREVREKRGLVYGINTGRSEVGDVSVFMTSFGAGIDNVAPALDVARQEITRFLAEGPTEDEMETVKSSFAGSFFLGLDTNEKLVNQVQWMLRDNLPITYLDDYAAELDKITAADVKAVMNQAIKPEFFNTVVVGKTPADFRLDGRAVTPPVQ